MKRLIIIGLIIILLIPYYPVHGATVAADDSYIRDDIPNTNYSTSEYLPIGHRTSTYRYSLLRFDLSTIPSSAKVAEAMLSLFLYSISGSENMTIQVYRVNRPWIENEVTWNEYSTGNIWQSPGASGIDDISSPIAIIPVLGTYVFGQKCTFDLSPIIVQEWIDKSVDNNGFLLKAQPPPINTAYSFVSSKHTYSVLYPQLSIIYELPSAMTTTVVITDTTIETHELSSGNEWALYRQFSYGEMLIAALLFFGVLAVLVFGLFFVTKKSDV